MATVTPMISVYNASIALIRERQRLVQELLGPNRNASYRKYYAYIVQAVDSIENMIRLGTKESAQLDELVNEELALWAKVDEYVKRMSVSRRQLSAPKDMPLSPKVKRKIENQIEMDETQVNQVLKEIRKHLAWESAALLDYVPKRRAA